MKRTERLRPYNSYPDGRQRELRFVLLTLVFGGLTAAIGVVVMYYLTHGGRY